MPPEEYERAAVEFIKSLNARNIGTLADPIGEKLTVATDNYKPSPVEPSGNNYGHQSMVYLCHVLKHASEAWPGNTPEAISVRTETLKLLIDLMSRILSDSK
jgi:hypothetical protein